MSDRQLTFLENNSVNYNNNNNINNNNNSNNNSNNNHSNNDNNSNNNYDNNNEKNDNNDNNNNNNWKYYDDFKTRTTIMINEKIEYSKDARTVQCSTYPSGFA